MHSLSQALQLSHHHALSQSLLSVRLFLALLWSGANSLRFDPTSLTMISQLAVHLFTVPRERNARFSGQAYGLHHHKVVAQMQS